jgi:hypothetical protein
MATKQQLPDFTSTWRVMTEAGHTDVVANFAIVVSGALSFKDAAGNLVQAWAMDQWQQVERLTAPPHNPEPSDMHKS